MCNGVIRTYLIDLRHKQILVFLISSEQATAATWIYSVRGRFQGVLWITNHPRWDFQRARD